MGKKNEVTVAEQNLPVSEALAELANEAAGEGMEGMGAEDFALPMIYVLQKMSPQLDELEDAQAGDFYHTVLQTTFPGEEGLVVVPVKFEKVFVEWIPRERGGGFVNVYNDRREAERYADEENEIIDTAQWYVLIQTAEGIFEPAVIPMTSTKLRVSRNWATRAKMKKQQRADSGEYFTPPLYAYAYRLTTVQQSNDKGTWHNLKVDDESPLVDFTEEEEVFPDGFRIMMESRNFLRNVLAQGQRGVDYEKAAAAADSVESDADEDEIA